MLEALDQDAVTVERAEAFRADHLVQPARPRPLEDALEQRRRHFAIVGALEQIEPRSACLVVSVIRSIFQRRDPAYNLAVALGDEEAGVGVLVEGVFVAVELQFGVGANRRHPQRMIAVQCEREAQEAMAVGATTRIDLANSEHNRGLIPRRCGSGVPGRRSTRSTIRRTGAPRPTPRASWRGCW